jgi:hypothetical protein
MSWLHTIKATAALSLLPLRKIVSTSFPAKGIWSCAWWYVIYCSKLGLDTYPYHGSNDTHTYGWLPYSIILAFLWIPSYVFGPRTNARWSVRHTGTYVPVVPTVLHHHGTDPVRILRTPATCAWRGRMACTHAPTNQGRFQFSLIGSLPKYLFITYIKWQNEITVNIFYSHKNFLKWNGFGVTCSFYLLNN